MNPESEIEKYLERLLITVLNDMYKYENCTYILESVFEYRKYLS